MLIEPDLDRAVLTAALQRHYGLMAGAVCFIPAGETAWCYWVTDERDGQWFLKLVRPGAIEPARAEFALQLAGALAGLGLPVPAADTRWGAVVLAGWAAGGRVRVRRRRAAQRPGPARPRGGQAGGPPGRRRPRGHPALAVPVPFVETFEVWTDGLRRCLAELKPGAGGAGGLRAQARALVWPQRGVLQGMLERVQALGDAVRRGQGSGCCATAT
jgi:hypothetical protein